MSFLTRILGIKPPDQSVAGWHVSPVVDIAAYHFSWLWVLVPLLMVGDRHPKDYLLLFLLIVAGNFLHQAVSLPFVYLDKDVFARNRVRFTVLPLIVLLLFIWTLVFWKLDYDARGKHWMPFFLVVATIAYAWNFWHVYMQKYGILRLHEAKTPTPSGERVPGWVDRLLVFSWLPLTFCVVAQAKRTFFLKQFPYLGATINAIADFIEAWRLILVPVSIALVVFAAGAFIYHEWRVHRLRSLPRISAGLGMTLMSASIVFLNPIKAIIAFGFSHVIEYLVFVWAYQRRHYREPLPHGPLLGRILTRPWIAFGAFIIVVGGGYFVLNNWNYVFHGKTRPMVIGIPLATIMALVTLYNSVVHFYFDGFLWKMRRPTVRADI